MKKVFLMNQFGSPFDWNQKWVDNVQHLGKYGYDFMIFTPNDIQSKGNVKVISMSIDGFNKQVMKNLGVNPAMRIVNGHPNYHITDFIIGLGAIFSDYIGGYDFWGATGFDDVFGRLDHFIKDSDLEQSDIFSDDVGIMNGNMLLMRNNEKINNLFKAFENWQEIFSQHDCAGCVGQGECRLYSPEEIQMNAHLDEFKQEGIRFKFPPYFAFHGYDRLSIHVPKPQLVIKDDNSLWEIIPDTKAPDWEHFHPMGREIGYFHFNGTKRWPL